jgi:hypothetical protein
MKRAYPPLGKEDGLSSSRLNTAATLRASLWCFDQKNGAAYGGSAHTVQYANVNADSQLPQLFQKATPGSVDRDLDTLTLTLL